MTEASPQERLIDRLSLYREALLECLLQTRRQIAWLDHALDDATYDSLAFIEPLIALLQEPTSEIRILLHRPDHVAAQAPRLLKLAAHFPEQLRIRILSPRDQAYETIFLIGDERNVAVRFSHHHPRGKYCIDAPLRARDYLAQFNAMWDAAEAGPDGASLGL